MADIGILLNAPVPVTLKGKRYWLKHLRIKDVFAWFEAQVVGEHISAAVNTASALPSDHAEAVCDEAFGSLPSGPELAQAMADALSSPLGCAQAIWLAMRRAGAAISLAQVQDILSSVAEPVAQSLAAYVVGIHAVEAVKDADKAADGETDADAREHDWREDFWLLADAYGWTPEQIGELSMAQWVAYKQGAVKRKIEQYRLAGIAVEDGSAGGERSESPLDERLAKAKEQLKAETGRTAFGLNEVWERMQRG